MSNTREEEMHFKTAPVDPRFQNTNQTYYCFTMYCDYQRCTKLLGEGNESCKYFQNVYKVICPNAWISKWDQQLEDGTFPVNLSK